MSDAPKKKQKPLPPPFPKLPRDRQGLLDWASKATWHTILDTHRPGVHEHAGLVVVLEGGHELFFETVADACRGERFLSAFMSIDGHPMPEWSRAQIRHIVGALVRAARIGEERDDRETYADLGGRYLRGCLFDGNVIDEWKMSTTEGAYRGAVRLADATKFLRGDDGERWPNVLYAVDQKAMYVVRGLFLSYSKRIVGRMNTATLNQQMRRVGWETVELHPRKPGAPKALRPHLHCWRISDGFEGIRGTDRPPDDDDADRGPMVPDGPASTRGRDARGRVSSARPMRDHGTTRWPR